jgi:hypothetical protein
MYLNDTQRTGFYESIGLNTKEFDMHVIIEVSSVLAGKSCWSAVECHKTGWEALHLNSERISVKEAMYLYQFFVWRSFPYRFYNSE